jgi:pyruvate/2-oxoglutarate dehydrogenase complex dihydrolipoamide acyltransferase (E2) component
MIAIVLPEAAWKDVEPGTEALVDKWLVNEGEFVRRGQPIANVVIVKANQEIVAPADGRIEKILIKAEETFGERQPIAHLREAT